MFLLYILYFIAGCAVLCKCALRFVYPRVSWCQSVVFRLMAVKHSSETFISFLVLFVCHRPQKHSHSFQELGLRQSIKAKSAMIHEDKLTLLEIQRNVFDTNPSRRIFSIWVKLGCCAVVRLSWVVLVHCYTYELIQELTSQKSQQAFYLSFMTQTHI